MDVPGARYLTVRDEDEALGLHPEAARQEVVDTIDELPFATFDQWRNVVHDLFRMGKGRQYRRGMNQRELAYFGCADRFFLLTTLLGRRDALHPWLYDRCREVEAEPDGFLDLWARYHYKSTIITFAGVIQEILRDPELTVGIFAGTKKIATPFLVQIKRELESNALLRETYPDVLWSNPTKDSPQWSDEGIIVKRQSNPKEATIEAYGLVQGAPTGRHFRLLVYDDLVDQDLVTNSEMVLKVTTAWELSDNLGAGEGTRKWHIGTRYSFNDTYGVLLNRGSVVPRIFPATHDGTMDGKPVFLSPEKWAQVRRDQPTTAAAQMLQNPTAGKDNVFRGEWLRDFEIRPTTCNIYIMIDPSKGRSATSDRTAMVVMAVDTAGNKYVVDGYCHRMNLSERWQALKGLYTRWSRMPGVQMTKVGYESYGLQTDVEYIKERQQIEELPFSVVELNWARDSATQSKRHRVERLQPDVQNSKFWLPSLVWSSQHQAEATWRIDGNTIIYRPVQGPSAAVQTLIKQSRGYLAARPIRRQDEAREVYDLTVRLIEEMLLFPFATHDDAVDAASRIYDLAPRPAAAGEDAKVSELNDQLA